MGQGIATTLRALGKGPVCADPVQHMRREEGTVLIPARFPKVLPSGGLGSVPEDSVSLHQLLPPFGFIAEIFSETYVTGAVRFFFPSLNWPFSTIPPLLCADLQAHQEALIDALCSSE